MPAISLRQKQQDLVKEPPWVTPARPISKDLGAEDVVPGRVLALHVYNTGMDASTREKK